jgi:hypothetical protein
MIVVNVFVFAVLLPLVVIALLGRRARRPLLSWFVAFVLALGVVGFGVLTTPSGWFGVPLRIAVLVLFAIAIVVSLRRGGESDGQDDSPIRTMVKIVIAVFFGSAAIGAIRAHAVPPGAIELGFPLTDGSYLIAHGGSHPAANTHFVTPAEAYAVDLVKLNAAGMRARGIYPNAAKRYAIFGDLVVSPCQSATILAAIDTFPDAPRQSVDDKHRHGNHVVLRCRDVNVTLAHLQRGSVVVRAGDKISRGAPLARVGNSGTSSEPHLHIHAERAGAAVPIRLDGRWLVRNAIIRK